VLVGFAAETSDLREHAMGKVRRKNLDLIVANDVSAPGVGFEHDTNAVILLSADGGEQDVPIADKREVARAVLDRVVALRSTTRQQPPQRNPIP
jgi:phosphopantothenoylcysteine decarboxylase / phosphopantothenate---cysteine ligase